ncbi:MAG TPA: hypothetical protein VLB50_01835 [Ignavibacteriaceae bacterium]|nr:hypothetical protein [Ignavibacteriaceae bacterium]
MEIIILKTNIKSREEFRWIKSSLKNLYPIEECTIDLEDTDKVVRVTGENLRMEEVVNGISSLGFACEELPG